MASLELTDTTQTEVVRAITIMHDHRQMLELLVGHHLYLIEVPHIDDVSFQELVKRSTGITVHNELPNWPTLDGSKTMRKKPVASQELVHFAKGWLILVEGHKGDLRLNRNRLAQLLGCAPQRRDLPPWMSSFKKSIASTSSTSSSLTVWIGILDMTSAATLRAGKTSYALGSGSSRLVMPDPAQTRSTWSSPSPSVNGR